MDNIDIIEYSDYIGVGAIIPFLATAYVYYNKEYIINTIIQKIKS